MNTTLDDRNTIRFNPKKLNFLKLFENKFGKINKWNNLKNKYHRSTIIKLGHEVTGSKSFQKLYHLLIKSLPLNFNKEIYNNRNDSFHLFDKKNLPPRMEGKIKEFKNYINLNNFSVKKNTNILGSLEFGGLSNYWGLQLENIYKKE